MTNETLHFPRAEPWSQDHLSLIFDKRLPHMTGDTGTAPLPHWEGRMHSYYECEGEQLAQALLAHLPGGLIDGLVAALLKHKASLLAVAYIDPADQHQGQGAQS